MSCEEVRDLLYLYLSEELEPEERAQIDSHLLTCEECRAILDEHRGLKSILEHKLIEKQIDSAKERRA